MKEKLQKKDGFVLLFAVTISAIFLAIALGVTNIAYKELRFGTNARAANDAFFAADTGVEYTLYNDRSTSDTYPPNSFTGPFAIPGLGNTGQSCAVVTVNKTVPSRTTIISKGYDLGGNTLDCTSSNLNRVEREIKVDY